MLELKSKLPGAGTTIFTVMSRMALEHGAINLSQGFPDFDGPPLLRERVAWHMQHGHNQYAPLAGIPELCEQIAQKVHALYGRVIDPRTEVTVTPGATEAIYCAVTAAVRPGDEAIIFDPAYDTYAPAIVLNGGITHRIPTVYPDFRIDWDRVRATVNARTRLIMLNTPHNPSATTWSQHDINCLREITDGSRICLVSDEVYEHIVFDGQLHLSLLRYPDLASRTFAVFSFGKTYHATGWRVGYCVAPAQLMQEFLRIHQYINFSTNAPMQYALADFLRECPEYPLSLATFYEQKRDLFCSLLGPSAFRLQPSAGTFFQLAEYSSVSDEPDFAFVTRLTREHKVAAIPVSVFYEHPPEQRVIRFCFAKGDDTLREAAARLLGV